MATAPIQLQTLGNQTQCAKHPNAPQPAPGCKPAVLLTHGEGYSLDDGTAVRRTVAEQWRTDFFGDQELPTQRKGGPALAPNDDGLFPGHSQTWRVV